MRTTALIAFLLLTPGCTVLSALGLGPTDLAPSLKYCHQVEYKRVGIDAELRAKCTVPAG